MAGAGDLPEEVPDLLHVEAGKIIFREGDAGDKVYVVLEGKAELRVGGYLLETVSGGGILGEMALIEQAPGVATATAKTAAELLPISEKRFMSMIQQTPSFALQIMKVIAARLRKMDALFGRRKTIRKRPPAPTSRPKAARRRSSRR